MEWRIIAFQPEHLLEIQGRGRDFEALELGLAARLLGAVRKNLLSGVAFTGVLNGRIMGCAGIALYWPGMGEAWLVGTELVPRFPKLFHRAVKEGLETMMRGLGLRRLQCSVPTEHHQGRKWVKALGFREEGEMLAYGPDGADHIRFARIMPPALAKEG
jgi:hypothetical protein